MKQTEQNQIELRVQAVPHPGAADATPRRMTEGSAGLDLCAAVSAPVRIGPGKLCIVPTGVAVGLPSGFGGFVFARSGLSMKHGITLANGVGVIDSDYTGEISVGLINLSDTPYTVEPGERVAQLVVLPVPAVHLLAVECLGPTARGTGGFGSTGKL